MAVRAHPITGGLIAGMMAFAMSSCGLVFQGTTENITVSSEPSGADVTLNDGEKKVTPFTISAPREKDLQFHFSKPGYQPVDLTDNSRVEPGILVIDSIPLLIPWAIDASYGAGFAHQETVVAAHLDREPATAGVMGNESNAPAQPRPSPAASSAIPPN